MTTDKDYRHPATIETSCGLVMRFQGQPDPVREAFLFDAQTSGGLLISVPKGKLDQLLSELDASGVQTKAVVGEITAGNPGRISVSP